MKDNRIAILQDLHFHRSLPGASRVARIQSSSHLKGSTSVSSSEVNMAEATPVTQTAILQDLTFQSTTTDLFLEAEGSLNKIFISQKGNYTVFPLGR